MLGVNDDGLCVITLYITACRSSCVVIIGIWNNAFVFLVGAGTAGYYSSIIGCWDVCVVVGVWSASTVCYSSNSSGEVFSCMGCRRGERCIGYRFSVCFIFLF